MIYTVLAITLATTGQLLLARHNLWGLLPYGLAIFALWRFLEHNPQVAGSIPSPAWGDAQASPQAPRALAGTERFPRVWRWLAAPLALAFTVLAFIGAAGNRYRWYGVLAWLLSTGLFLLIFWERDRGRSIRETLGLSRAGVRLSWTALAVLGLIMVGVWFRFWRLAELPPEMTSDHIEKLLDVHDLVTGQRPVFFVRNTGREPWQFYWTLMFIQLFDLETKYLALKLGTAAVSLLTLPGVYLLGRHLFGKQTGLWATLFTAVASWPVILSRVGLRFPFAPAVTAWSLFFLLRGLRDGRRNDFLLLGLSLGIGLQGYTAFRIMPLAVVVCWILAWLVTRWRGSRTPRHPAFDVRTSGLLTNAMLTVLIALVVFVPLGRYALDHPENFWMRSFSRMADPEQPMTGGPVTVLLRNLVDLGLVFHWQGDDVWVNTLTGEPVLDPVLGGLLVLGVVIVAWRAWRWRDLVAPLLLVAGVILLLPSALSLAYPVENPSVVRIGGAIPAVMVSAALPVSRGLARAWQALRGWHRQLLILGAGLLAMAIVTINYQRYFGDYWHQYQDRALNTSEIGLAINGFIESGGDPDDAWIIAWPYWIDTRGAGIEIGDPTWNNVILDLDELDAHRYRARPRFYVYYPNDHEARERLETLFPNGWATRYRARGTYPDFMLFYVPPKAQAIENDGSNTENTEDQIDQLKRNNQDAP